MNLKYLLGLGLLCAGTVAQAENTYPTIDRVNYALNCMDKRGGNSATNLSGCACEIDFIASKMSFDDFSDASAYAQFRDLPGDKGGVFRDNKHAADAFGTLRDLVKQGRKLCFVKEVVHKDGGKPTAPNTTEAAGKP